jgi:hypothetical protein
MPGLADAGTLEELSVLCGTARSGKGRERVTERVVMPEVIERLPGSRALVLHANLSPVVVKFRTPWRRWSYRLGRLPQPPRPLPLAVPELVPELVGPPVEGSSDAAA